MRIGCLQLIFWLIHPRLQRPDNIINCEVAEMISKYSNKHTERQFVLRSI